MWAPWVVVTVFLLVLAFTHWFLQPPRAAEMGRLYVGTLSLLCSILLTVMVTIMTPLSLPTDIQQQTIYTVVSKPVRRIELIWGRMIGYMAIVTVLVLAFGGISLFYLSRTVGGTLAGDRAGGRSRRRRKTVSPLTSNCSSRLTRSVPECRPGFRSRARSRSSTRAAAPQAIGIDVGSEQSMKEPRSHIEGATQSAAIWRFGDRCPIRSRRPGGRPNYLNRRIPVEDFILPGTIEWHLDRVYELGAPDRRGPSREGTAQRDRGSNEPARRGDQSESARARAGPRRVRGHARNAPKT